MERELNDEIETEKTSHRQKLRAQQEDFEKQLESKGTEIERLEDEVKSLLQKERGQSKAIFDAQSEVAMLRKQLKAVSSEAPSKAEVAALKKTVEEQAAALDKERIQRESLRKEAAAFDVIKSELEKVRALADEREGKVREARAASEAMAYEARRAKEEKAELMAHYDGLLKKKTEELALEKREAKTFREVMSKATPKKRSRDLAEAEEEARVLREELQKKTDLIKTLEAMIPAAEEQGGEEDDDGEDEENPRQLKRKLAKAAKEQDKLKASHAKELSRLKKGYERVIAEYKEANLELQRRVTPSEASSVLTDASTLEADNSRVEEDDEEDARRATSARKRTRASTRARRTRQGSVARADTSVQASFEDSNLENGDPNGSYEEPAKRPRSTRERSSRVTRQRPVRKAKLSESSQLEPLRESSNCGTPSALTPAGKKKLFDEPKAAQVFTPPLESASPKVTPRTIVKRQLRSRSSRKK